MSGGGPLSAEHQPQRRIRVSELCSAAERLVRDEHAARRASGRPPLLTSYLPPFLTPVCLQALEDIFLRPGWQHPVNMVLASLHQSDPAAAQREIDKHVTLQAAQGAARVTRQPDASSAAAVEEESVPETFALNCGHHICQHCWEGNIRCVLTSSFAHFIIYSLRLLTSYGCPQRSNRLPRVRHRLQELSGGRLHLPHPRPAGAPDVSRPHREIQTAAVGPVCQPCRVCPCPWPWPVRASALP